MLLIRYEKNRFLKQQLDKSHCAKKLYFHFELFFHNLDQQVTSISIGIFIETVTKSGNVCVRFLEQVF